MAIFADQLQDILRQRSKELNSLYGVYVNDKQMHGWKIIRLKEAANGRKISATLNQGEISAVEQHFHFSASEKRRLSCALIAEAMYRMLLDRFPVGNKAMQQSEMLFHLLFDADQESFEMLRRLIAYELSDGFMSDK